MVLLSAALIWLLGEILFGGVEALFRSMRASADREDGLEQQDDGNTRMQRRHWPEWTERTLRTLAGLLVVALLTVLLIPRIQMQALRLLLTGLGLTVAAVLVVEMILPVDITGFVASLVRRQPEDRDLQAAKNSRPT